MAHTNEFAMPDVGEGLTEAEIVTWHVKPGDTVAINAPLVEVETAKSLVELPSPYAGVITELRASEGETVEVGAVIVCFGEAVGGSADAPPRDAAAPQSETPEPVRPMIASPDDLVDETENEERQPVLVGYGPSRAKVTRRPRKPGYQPPQLFSSPVGQSPRAYATPPVRRRAKDLDIDLATVSPTGEGGRITHRDLEAYQASSAAAPGEPAETRIAIKGVRRATAEAMMVSAFSAPHVTEWVTVDVTESMELLEQMRSDRTYAGVRLTPLVLVLRAALSALRHYPEINAKWDAAAGEIVQYRDINLGIAAATPRGLLVPNIKAAQELGTLELCESLAQLIAQAREGKTQPADMAHGTFTVTNIGVFGVDGATPILNPGEAGILCVGQIVKRPWEHRGDIALRDICTLSLSFDHRLVDGQLGSQVLAHIARLLGQPSLALVN
ncbi:dihydrolipoamide acetyltransferase family protein [Rhodococcus erythropolis]|uniref:dihydrolipoamide acetyltransferase family protein n=1 Tax=Rhodococcus erythropolis TaxID=1833 RepID=UPI00294A6676|nr:dihydrolipoamide acetyltransferase family protein [Rhodococcus erythropolis]MDV6212770.1 dihydrolipoamide acetyltransferase family protein [Rhodococcus erythropolis]